MSESEKIKVSIATIMIYIVMVLKYFKSEQDIILVGEAADGKKLNRSRKIMQPDVVLTDE